MLYFAQAREVKRLREWAGRAPERDAELAQRVTSDAQKRVVAQPMAPMTTAAQQAEAARTAAAAALYAKLPAPPPPPAPLVGPPGQLARPVVPGVPPAEPAVGSVPSGGGAVASPQGTPAPGSVPGAAAGPATATPTPTPMPATSTPTPTPTPAPAPGAVAPAAAAAAARQSSPPSAFPLGNGAGQETHESAAARPEPLQTFQTQDEGPSIARIGAIAGCAVGAVLVAVVLMVALSGDDTAPKPNDFGSVTQPAASPAAPDGSTSTNASGAGDAVNRRATRVAVLNGTTQTGLARALADEVEKARFTIAGTENNADQAVPTTTVSYRPGNERAAQIVAQVIGIDRGSVQPVDANTTAAADADVVVIVGGDKIG